MHTIHATEKTDSDGALNLRIPLGRPDAEFEVVIVLQQKLPGTGTTAPTSANPWAVADAIRQRLAATGRDFGDSVQDLRE